MVEKSSARCAQFSAPHIEKLPHKAQTSVDKSFRQQRCQQANRLSRCAFECDCRPLASCSRLPTQAPTDDKIVPLSDMPVANSRRPIASLMSLICHTIGGAIAIIFLLTLPLSVFPAITIVASAPYTDDTSDAFAPGFSVVAFAFLFPCAYLFPLPFLRLPFCWVSASASMG